MKAHMGDPLEPRGGQNAITRDILGWGMTVHAGDRMDGTLFRGQYIQLRKEIDLAVMSREPWKELIASRFLLGERHILPSKHISNKDDIYRGTAFVLCKKLNVSRVRAFRHPSSSPQAQ